MPNAYIAMYIAFIAVAVRIVSGTANQALRNRSEQANGA